MFVTVDVSIKSLDSTGVSIIFIKVKEQWYTIPQPILQPSDRNINEWLFQYGANLSRVNFGVRVFQKNFRGRKETVKVTLQAGFTNNYDISYDIPYINKKQRTGLTLFCSYSNNRSIAFATDTHKLQYISTNGIIRNSYRAGFALNYRKHFFTVHSIEASFNYNHVNDTIAKLNPDYFLYGRNWQRYFQLKYSYNFDKRDVRQFPHKGTAVRVDVEQLGFTNYESQKLTRAFFTWQWYTEVGKHFLFATRFKTKVSIPLLQPYTEFKALGYNQDFVRGYELYPVDGQNYLLSRNSFRYKIYSNIIDFGRLVPIRQFRTLPVAFYFTVFSDWGYVYRTNPQVFNNTRFSNTPLGSVGGGLNFVTYYNSVLRLEYSYNLAGQLHFFFSMAADI